MTSSRRHTQRIALIVPICVFMPWCGLAGAQTTDAVAAGFHVPPAHARLRLFWRIFGPAWTPAEIDFQLGEMQRAGVGGVMVCCT